MLATFLISSIKDEKWEAHTGGWNNVFETSSLCLEALIKCGVDCENGLVNDVVNYLLRNSQMWMLENNEIDGATTACSLLVVSDSMALGTAHSRRALDVVLLAFKL